MQQYDECPRCGFNKPSSIFTGSYFNVYRCTECEDEVLYCYECEGTNGGNVCPECGSGEYEVVGEVQLE